MKWLRKLFGLGPTTAERLASLEQVLKENKTDKETLETRLKQTETELHAFRVQDDQNKTRYTSTAPWVEITSSEFDPIKGLKIELDWNDAFIQYLKENGIKGKSDDETVQKWIAFLYQDLVEKLEEQVINENSKPRISDFS